MADEQIPILRHTKDVIGAYLTDGSRLRLYSYLDRLQEWALYYDTDSIMFVQPRDEPALVETGDHLGAMTSELRHSEFIEEFVNAGPKNYAYKIVDSVRGVRKTVCKVRGIKLNYKPSKPVNFEFIKDMILGKNRDGRSDYTHREENQRNRKAGGGVVSIITETVEIYKELHFSRGGDYTTIHHCCLGINRRGYLLSTSFLDQCFNYYL